MKVKLAIYRDRKLIGVFGVNLTRTKREIRESDLTEDELKALMLKYRFERR